MYLKSFTFPVGIWETRVLNLFFVSWIYFCYWRTRRDMKTVVLFFVPGLNARPERLYMQKPIYRCVLPSVYTEATFVTSCSLKFYSSISWRRTWADLWSRISLCVPSTDGEVRKWRDSVKNSRQERQDSLPLSSFTWSTNTASSSSDLSSLFL